MEVKNSKHDEDDVESPEKMVDKGTQNYEGYFPGEALAMPK